MRIWSEPAKGAGNQILVDVDSKTWDLSDEQEREEFYNLCMHSAWVEGYQNGSADLSLTWDDPANYVNCSELVKFTFIASLCGQQPDPTVRHYWQNSYHFPHLTGCEWSVTDNDELEEYNCIAHSVDDPYCWYNESDIDRDFGDNNGIFENADMDAFYYDQKGWTPTASGAEDAEVMYFPYSQSWDYGHGYPRPSGGGYHAARRHNCNCGAGKWIMYTGKLGQEEQIEHIWDKLNGPSYRYPDRFYK